jgi:hypothetical protein
MTQPCPDREELAAWLDREVGQRRAEAIQHHVAVCSVCIARVAAIEQLIACLRAPAFAPSPGAVGDVLARLDTPAPRRVPRTWLAGAMATAAIALAALAIRPSTGSGGGESAIRMPDPGDGFQPRGGGSGGLERHVDARLYAVAPPGAASPGGPRVAALAAGAAVRGDTAFTLGYRNLAADRALWLLSFAVDASGEIHWLYPAYSRADEDPVAVRLSIASAEILMPDSVVLERPAAGRMRVMVLIAPAPLRVSAIEALAPPQLGRAELQRQFPDATISELPLRVVP